MTVPARPIGKCGRRAPKRAPMLKLGPLLTGKIPAHPAAADYLAALRGGWLELGNDVAGDCVAVTWANVRRLVTTTLTEHPSYPDQDQVWQVYRTQNPDFDPDGDPEVNGPGSPADRGMDVQTLLEYLVREGGPDGVKAAAFASVDPKNPAEVKAAIAIFGYVWTGINVQQANEQEFSDGQPWDYDPSGSVLGGHSVITGGYGAETGSPALGGDEKFITWATETSFTDAFWANEAEEAFVVIWPEHLGSGEFLEGVSAVQLAADYRAITGRPLPVPAHLTGEAPMSLITQVEGKIRQYWTELTGEAREELEKALQDVTEREAKLAPLVADFEAALKSAVAAVEPEVRTAVEALVAKLGEDVAAVLGGL